MYNEKDLFPNPENNEVIGFINGKAIMTSPDYPNSLFFTEIAEEYVTIGEHLVEATLYPVELLSPEECGEIKRVIEERGVKIAT